MARKKIKLTKKVYSNQKIRDQVSLDFQKLAKTKHSVNEKRLKEIYDEIFYDIPINGKNSHKNIVEQTYEYLYHNRSKNLESIIKNLSQQVIAKTTELEAYNVSTPEHDVYENGALLMHGTNGQPYQDSNYIWVMQEGRKRRFESDTDPVFIETKKALKLPIDTFDGRYFVPASELNNIPNGTYITKTEDLNLKGDQIIPEGGLPEIAIRHAYIQVELECMGNEIEDYSAQVINGEINYSQAQFRLGNSGCVVKYLKDDFKTDHLPLTIEHLSMYKGEKRVIRVLRNGLGPEDTGIPNNIGEIYQQEGAYSVQDVSYNNTDIVNYEKNWGPFGLGDYPGIVYANGRILAKNLPNEYLQNILLVPNEDEQKILNGLPNSIQTSLGISDLTIVDGGQGGVSSYGTKMIYRGSGVHANDTTGDGVFNLWGNLNQSADLQSSVFDDPSNKYYKHNINVDKDIGQTPVYGQPILRYMSTYCVLMGGYVSNATRKLRFLDLESGDFFTRRKSQVEDDLDWMMITSAGLGILGMDWNTSNDRELYNRVVTKGYIGLKGYNANMQMGPGNPFNNSSNYRYPAPLS